MSYGMRGASVLVVGGPVLGMAPVFDVRGAMISSLAVVPCAVSASASSLASRSRWRWAMASRSCWFSIIILFLSASSSLRL